MPPPAISEADPEATWAALASDSDAVLIDVRTQAEWSFVGVPDISELGRAPSFIEWMTFPAMAMNERFLDMTMKVVESAEEAFFICRSGHRSREAAMLVAETAAARGRELTCVNVSTGFEGDLDPSGRRGRVNGWKAAGLPWRQG